MSRGFIPDNTNPLDLSTCPFDAGWATEAMSSHILISAESCKCSFSKICAIISYDTVRITVSQDDVFEKCHGRSSITFSYRFHFNPFCKLIHHDQNVSHISPCWFERANHIQAPYGKWPCNWYGLEFRHWHMCLGSIPLTTIAFSHQIFCLF